MVQTTVRAANNFPSWFSPQGMKLPLDLERRAMISQVMSPVSAFAGVGKGFKFTFRNTLAICTRKLNLATRWEACQWRRSKNHPSSASATSIFSIENDPISNTPLEKKRPRRDRMGVGWFLGEYPFFAYAYLGRANFLNYKPIRQFRCTRHEKNHQYFFAARRPGPVQFSKGDKSHFLRIALKRQKVFINHPDYRFRVRFRKRTDSWGDSTSTKAS